MLSRLSVLPMAALGHLACSGGDKDGTDPTQDSGDAAVDCSDATYEVPSPRAEQDGVWDATRDRLVFFGGDEGMPEQCIPKPDYLAETVAWNQDCGDFEVLDTGGGPSMRTRLATTLDAGRDRMIIHGGRYREAESGRYTLYDDLWAFDLETESWSELPSDDGPSKRAMHTMVVAGDTLYLYGGQLSNSSTSYSPGTDFWAYDLGAGTWTELDADADPGERLFHSMAVSDDGSKLWIYGGADENALFGPFFEDLWEYDVAAGTWTELHGGGKSGPDGRIWADLVYNGADDTLLLWAGHDDGSLGNTNQVWTFDLAAGAWDMTEEGDVQEANANGFCDFPADFVEIDPDAPERRYAGIGVFTGSELVIFGGKTDCGQSNDLWSYDPAGATWTEHSAATFGEVCLRTTPEEDCASLCY